MKKFHSIVWREDKYFVAKALEVEIASQGKTEQEALKNLEEALELYFEDNKHPEIIKIEQPKLQDISLSLNA